jgi:hypothetical protein
MRPQSREARATLFLRIPKAATEGNPITWEKARACPWLEFFTSSLRRRAACPAPEPPHARRIGASPLNPQFRERLARILPPERLLEDEVSLLTYECDGYPIERNTPCAVAFPESTDELLELVRICLASGVPIMPRGAGTCLSGGATPDAQAPLLLELARMRGLISIDYDDRIAVVQPGYINFRLGELAEEHGFTFAPDPSSQKALDARWQRRGERRRPALLQIRHDERSRARHEAGHGARRAHRYALLRRARSDRADDGLGGHLRHHRRADPAAQPGAGLHGDLARGLSEHGARVPRRRGDRRRGAGPRLRSRSSTS